MPTTREDIERWFDRGVASGHSHMIVMCDTFDHDDYPSFFTGTPEEARAYAEMKGREPMQRLMEVYHLRGDKALQLQSQRNFVYGDEPGSNVVAIRQPASASPSFRPLDPEGGLSRKQSFAELVDWKLHWFTMDVEAAVRSVCGELQTLRRSPPPLTREKIQLGLDKLHAVVVTYNVWLDEVGIMMGLDDRSSLVDLFQSRPRYVQFMAQVRQAQVSLLAHMERLQEHERAVQNERFESFFRYGRL